MPLSDDERLELLRAARSSIQSVLDGIPAEPPTLQWPASREPKGVFVTLRLDGELRGCIGYVEPKLPLSTAVWEVAQKSAFEDPRFAPLTAEELNRIEIEISVLSPLKRISSPEEIEVGTHGLVVDAGYTRGLLLPHVAVEQGWDREQFLNHTSLKAGLDPQAWKRSGVHLYTFTTETFSEGEFSHD